MPREMKGRSPQFAPNKERVPIDTALEKLYSLLESWGISPDHYVMVDEFAYLLQGYEVSGPEIQEGHLDIYVDPQVVPWPPQNERSLMPKAQYWDQYQTFMKETGYGLDLLTARPEIFQVPFVEHELPSGHCIRLMRAFEMTDQFVKRTIMHYTIEEVGEEKIRQWIEKLKLLQSAAEKKYDYQLAEFCRLKFQESQEKWKEII